MLCGSYEDVVNFVRALVCVCVFIKLHITTWPGPVMLIFQCYRYGSTLWCVYAVSKLLMYPSIITINSKNDLRASPRLKFPLGKNIPLAGLSQNINEICRPFKTKQNLIKLFSKIEIPTKNATQFSPSRYEMFEILKISPENAMNNR